jgi:hypothetical protein
LLLNKKVLKEAVTVVNFISSRALNPGLFSKLRKAMGSDYDKLLLHAEVRWLSRGRVLRRLVKLKEEVKLCLTVENPTLADLFHNENWPCNLSYVSDIIEKLNESNTFLLHDRITAFVKKIPIWKKKL